MPRLELAILESGSWALTPLEFVIKISRQNCIPEPSSNEEIDILQAGSDQAEVGGVGG